MKVVVCGVVIKDGKILLVLNPDSGLWILPGGKPEPGETDTQALTREFGQELPGLKVSKFEYYQTFTAHTPNSGDVREFLTYLVDAEGDISPAAEIRQSDWYDGSNDFSLTEVTAKIVKSLKREGLL